MPIMHNGELVYREGEPIDHHDHEGRHPYVMNAKDYDFLVSERARKNAANRKKKEAREANASAPTNEA